MIEGRLINLRAPELADLERNAGWVNDREVTQYLSVRYEMSLAAEEAWLRDLVSKPLSYDRPFFAVETKDGVHIGNTNLFEVKPEDRKAKLGIMIGDKPHWSKGYGSDALRTLLGFAFGEMNLNRVELDVFDFNERGIAAYRKCGFVEEGRRRQAVYRNGAFHDVIVMAVLRDEWEGAGG